MNKKITIIDADGLPYIIGWNHAGTTSVKAVHKSVDSFVTDILSDTKADVYIGMIEPQKTDVPCFRHDIAKTKPYKGSRGEKPDWYKFWCPVIQARLVKRWGFHRAPEGMETDDIVCALFSKYNKSPEYDAILAGNDKDLHQMPGLHYNFKTQLFQEFTPVQANYNLFYQVLIGDTTDSIPGLAKCGPKGAESLLNTDNVGTDNYHVVTLYAFTNKLGLDKGIQSFYENYMLCKMRDDLPVDHIEPTEFNTDYYDGLSDFEEDEVEEDNEPIDDLNLFDV